MGKYVGGTLLQGATECDDLGQRLRDTGVNRADRLDHQLTAMAPVLGAIRAGHALIDVLADLDLGVAVVGEQRGEPIDLLPVRSLAPVQGASGLVERVAGAAARRP